MLSTIRFYFDYVSPNAYLAWTQLPEIAQRHAFVIEPVPVLFAGLLEAHGQLGPAEVPAKMRWMSRNNLRKAALLRVGLNPPAFHPFNPLLALRVSSLSLGTEEKQALIGVLFRAVWVRGLHVSDRAEVTRLVDEIGLKGTALIAEAEQPECKTRLREQTEDAISRGVFGVPTMEVDGELFWGYDDLPYLELLLAGNDPLDRTDWQKWAAAPQPSAARRSLRPNKEDT
jgi:2-hydroxychromene-2-carboxylate isomerase